MPTRHTKAVQKAVILDAVAQFAPEHVTRLAKLKKADIASEAERLAEGTGWMPAVLKADAESSSKQAEDPQARDTVSDDVLAESQADEPIAA